MRIFARVLTVLLVLPALPVSADSLFSDFRNPPDEIVFVGDDFGDGGGDSHVRLKGMDYIEIEDYREFQRAVSILLRD